jgi:hypothetical protein
MKNLFNISEEERNRILDIHETSTKNQYLNVISEQKITAPINAPVNTTTAPQKDAKAQATIDKEKSTKPIAKKLPTDFTKNVNFYFADKTFISLTPQKQDLSKLIISTLGLGSDLSNHINLINLPVRMKDCPNNKMITIFTKGTDSKTLGEWCSYENLNPQYLSKNGIFQVKKDPNFVYVGTWGNPSTQMTNTQVK